MVEEKTSMSVVLSASVMEICWLYAWAEFILHSAFGVVVPLLYVVGLFIAGIVARRFIVGRQRIRIVAYLARFITFALVFVGLTKRLIFIQNSRSSVFNLTYIVSGQPDAMEWLLLIIILPIGVAIWKRGGYFGAKEPTLTQLYLCFDGAVAAFMVLLIVKLLALAKFDTALSHPSLIPLFLPMFLFGFLMFGLKLSRSSQDKRFISRFQKLGVVFSFASVALIAGIGVVSLFQTQMTAVAGVISTQVSKGGQTFLSVIVSILLWMKGERKGAIGASSAGGDNTPDFTAEFNESSLFVEIMKWVIIVLGVLLIAIVLVYTIRLLLKFLLAKRDIPQIHQPGFFAFLLRLILALLRLPALLRQFIPQMKRAGTGYDLYLRLIRWGRHSGIPMNRSDTPLEYKKRIAEQFPEVDASAEIVIQLLYEEIYRGSGISAATLAGGKKALNQMRHPRWWSKRAKNWLLSAVVTE